MPLKKFRHDFLHLAPLFGQPHPNRTSVNLAALVVHIPGFDQLFQVIADIGALVISPALQFARCHFVIADVEQQQRLDRVHL